MSTTSTMDFSHPPVNLLVTGALDGGTSGELGLTITDAATGRPVDDLLVHDNALVHLVIVGPSGEL